MILEKPIQQFGSVDLNKTTEFQIDITPKLFEMLSGLYPNKIRAVIRELLCNAIDSHIVAGISDVPVDIHVPTAEHPYLTIRDYGVGMSPEDVTNIYSRYSKSTKQHDASTTGALGLGSKSPFCYTNMFTLRSVYDGVESLYNVYMNSQRIPCLTMLSQKPSDDENGVTVTVPVKVSDYDNFDQSLRFVLFHTKSPVKVYRTVQTCKDDDVGGEYVGDGETGTEIEEITDGFTMFVDNIEHTQQKHFHFLKHDPWRNSSTGVYVLQANVIYPVQDADLVSPLFTAALRSDVVLVLEVPNGSVSFSPTREELSMDIETIDIITNMVAECAKKAQSWSKFYGIYTTRYRKQRKDDPTEAELPLVLRKPFWKYLYNYKRVKSATDNVTYWRSQYPNNTNGGKHNGRWVIRGYKAGNPSYQNNFHEMCTTATIGYIITSKYQSVGDVEKLSTTDMISNMYKWFDVDPSLNTVGTLSAIVCGKDIREVWSKIRKLGTKVKLVEIDESKFQQIYKAPPKPRSPTRLFVMRHDGRYIQTKDEQISDFENYSYYVVRKNRSIVRKVNDTECTIGMDEFTGMIKGIREANQHFGHSNIGDKFSILILTQGQCKKILKDFPNLSPLWDGLITPKFREVMERAQLVRTYSDVSVREIRHIKGDNLVDIFASFADDPNIQRTAKRVLLEYDMACRLMGGGKDSKLYKLYKDCNHCNPALSTWGGRQRIYHAIDCLSRLGMGPSHNVRFGIQCVKDAFERADCGRESEGPYSTIVEYIQDTYFRNRYDMADPHTEKVYMEYIRYLFKRSSIMRATEMKQAYDHAINLLDKLATRR